ncbi:MAG: hypothetical protein WA667_24145 [Candidatus Nitrosopolaris sp.]
MNKTLQRVAVIEEQIAQFNLPAVPENQETIKKVKSDTRTNTFIGMHFVMIAVR